jgi:hypothetical protein
VQANPALPVVQRLEDMWLLSKLQQERKAKQQQQQQQRKPEQVRSLAQQQQPASSTPATPSSKMTTYPITMTMTDVEHFEAADAAVDVLATQGPVAAKHAVVNSDAHGTDCCLDAAAATVTVTALADAPAAAGADCIHSADAGDSSSLVAEQVCSRLYELD